MTNLQLKMEVQGAAQNWVASVMQQNNIPAAMMEEALTKVLLNIKDLVLQDTIREMAEANTPPQEIEEKEEELEKDGTNE